MYESHQRRKDILLWCHSIPLSPSRSIKQKSRKHSSADSGEEDVPLRKSKTKADLCAKKLSEVEELVKKLTEKHQSKYSVEQMNTWAHMIHMGKHESLDQPPSVPYFKKPATERDTSDVTEKEKDHAIRSPSKLISNRTQSISQLKDLSTLLEFGGIDKEQYENFQKAILRDIFTDTRCGHSFGYNAGMHLSGLLVACCDSTVVQSYKLILLILIYSAVSTYV